MSLVPAYQSGSRQERQSSAECSLRLLTPQSKRLTNNYRQKLRVPVNFSLENPLFVGVQVRLMWILAFNTGRPV